MSSSQARSLQGRVILVTGASRGIGREIAVRVAADGATVVLLARTETPNPKLPGTLQETADAVRDAGGHPLPVICDVRDPAAVEAAVATVAAQCDVIDAVVNNAGALDLRSTSELPLNIFHRLLEVNVEGPFALVQAALPYLIKSANAHIVNVSPPLNLAPPWVAAHVGHTTGKYAESLLTLGWAAEFASIPVAVNSVWPATTVASTGMIVAMGDGVRARAREPQIMADAIRALLARSTDCTGNFYTDEEILRDEGLSDMSGYRLAAAEADLVPNFYLPSTALPTL
ncbi:SDR family oxidoreductase [Mycobacterium sp. MUNTM1]